jgi:hypothetical protein
MVAFRGRHSRYCQRQVLVYTWSVGTEALYTHSFRLEVTKHYSMFYLPLRGLAMKPSTIAKHPKWRTSCKLVRYWEFGLVVSEPSLNSSNPAYPISAVRNTLGYILKLYHIIGGGKSMYSSK